MLARIQNDLFDLGADLCTPDTGAKLDYEPLRVIDAQVERLEREIDELNASLKPLRSFVLPGGSPASAASAPRPHGQPPRRAADGRARGDARRAVGGPALRYMNRLSDFLFVASRTANSNGEADVLWMPGENR